MIESVLIWCGLITAIGTSLALLGLGVKLFQECVDGFWGNLSLNYQRTKAWVLFKRVQRRYVK